LYSPDTGKPGILSELPSSQPFQAGFWFCAKIQPMKKRFILLTLLAMLVSACGNAEAVSTPSMTVSPSVTPSATSTPSVTALQPTLTATPLLIDGTLTTKVNVRSGPAASFDSLGQLESGGKVQILARDRLSAWYLILYPPAPQGRGWVAANYVTVSTGAEVPLDATPTPSGPTGRVIQRLNVRSGPGTTFNSLGVLEVGAIVSLTGKNTTASWFQIDYPAGPDGHGWVTSQYIQTDSAVDLPVLDDYGVVVTPETAGTPGPASIPTPTVGPAYDDSDSSTDPAVRITFSSAGTNQFVYSSQVSAPEGDLEDWVQFTPYSLSGSNARLVFSLTCTGNGTLTMELWRGSTLLSGWGSLSCGDVGRTILLPAGQAYLVHLALSDGNGLRLVSYTLTAQNNP
jgi:uncharacterized protein YraI